MQMNIYLALLVFNRPLAKLENELKDIKMKKTVLQEQINEKKDKLKLINEEIAEIRTQIDSIRDVLFFNHFFWV